MKNKRNIVTFEPENEGPRERRPIALPPLVDASARVPPDPVSWRHHEDDIQRSQAITTINRMSTATKFHYQSTTYAKSEK